MALFKRKPEPVVSARSPSAVAGRAAVGFTGIAASSLERGDFTPYEFQTDTGTWVRLHDMQFVGFDYRVQTPTLTLRFVYNDPEWTPPGARATPVAVLKFRDALVHAWEDDDDLLGTPIDVREQVGDLEYRSSTNEFLLETVSTRLHFTASSLAVHLEPSFPQ
ncbi:hypothetical protein [Cellulomonas bogoriensis]|uniref:Uncharacterized protein n=1 Tax=Cellulomonas bogoriensis 69B4 = DSM 16987 TaxID=1386082 RepID=A0A0A0BKN2_9CELL|nr:hypothetical protein [Cellulomonas bogoriensis]KGM08551.1 hypothetical protein N869_10755 [Cellulomonas bogoriensis 69B4 = DSM 16987]